MTTRLRARRQQARRRERDDKDSYIHWLAVVAARDEGKGREAVAAIRAETGSHSVEFLRLDLGSLASVRAAARAFLAKEIPLRVLVNNAGVGGQRGRTADGFELHFGINHLGHFLLTTLLRDALVASSPARVVNVSSKAHFDAKAGIDWTRVEGSTRSFTGLPEYAASKLANVLFTKELARRLAGTGVTTYALHPGVIASDVWRRIPWPIRPLVTRNMLSVDEGARTTLHCATSPDVAAETGLYYDHCARRDPLPLANDPALARDLPERASSRAVTRPMPVFAPVTSATFMGAPLCGAGTRHQIFTGFEMPFGSNTAFTPCIGASAAPCSGAAKRRGHPDRDRNVTSASRLDWFGGRCVRGGRVGSNAGTSNGESATEIAGGDLFVGRTRELGALRAALGSAERGESRLVLIVGEPGIGKTRLAERIVREAGEGGARILRGRCWDGDGAPAYWPWTMAVRDLTRDLDPATVRRWLGSGSAAFAHLAPELVPDDPPLADAGDVEGVRFRVFDAVATLLRRIGLAQPVVLLLDDLHWADAASLRLLQFVAAQLPDARVLLLGTLRPVEARQRIDPEVHERLMRAAGLVELRGLALPEVAQLVRMHQGTDAPADLAARVHSTSEGNPLFVHALLRVMGGAPDPAGLRVPDDLRALLRTRVQLLAPTSRDILTAAALLGREFAVPVLARAVDAETAQVLAALDEAFALDLIAATSDGDRWRFAHALYAECLADDLPAHRRAALHGRIAQVLEPLVAAGTVPIDEIAAHYLHASAAGASEAALAWTLRAAEHARTRLAHEDEVRYYRRALGVLDGTALGVPSRRVPLLLRLADAERRVGDAEAARGTFHRAGVLALEEGLAEPLAEAALGYGAGFGGLQDQGGGTVDPERVRLLEAALAAIGSEPSGLRAQLLTHLAAALFWSGMSERRTRVRDLDREAVAMASAHADARVALGVLAQAHWTSWGPDDAEGRLRTAESIVRQATAQGRPELVLRGRMYAAAHHLELGDVVAADREVASFAELATELRMLRQRWYPDVYHAMRAYLAGRFDEMERLAEASASVGEVAHPFAARLAFRAQLTLLRREQGRTAETLDALRQMATTVPGMPVWRCALASGLAEVGDLAGARVELDHLLADDGASLPRDFLWLFGMTHLTRACVAVGDADRARLLYDLLSPYAGRVAVAQHGVLCDGAIDRYLGLLAGTCGEPAQAWQHYERALALNERLGATIFVTATQVDLAALVLRDGNADAVRRGEGLLAAAAAEGGRIGQRALLDRIDAMRGAGPAEPSAPVVADVCTLRRNGDEWTVTHGGRTMIVRHVIGFDYLATLLRHPATEVHALDLVTSADPSVAGSAGDAGVLLDDQARATYRRRLSELAAELEEARDFNDPGRAERAQAEIDALTGELARAVGLGGRARRAGAVAERARLNVTRAVRRAIDAIGAQDAALASDLGRGVRTGVFCSYTPDPRLPIRWEL